MCVIVQLKKKIKGCGYEKRFFFLFLWMSFARWEKKISVFISVGLSVLQPKVNQ